MVGIGKGAAVGVLIKSAEALERMEKVDTLVVDKTGTLTEGKPRVVPVVPAAGLSDAECCVWPPAPRAVERAPARGGARSHGGNSTHESLMGLRRSLGAFLRAPNVTPRQCYRCELWAQRPGVALTGVNFPTSLHRRALPLCTGVPGQTCFQARRLDHRPYGQIRAELLTEPSCEGS
jgi:hypothetical protein